MLSQNVCRSRLFIDIIDAVLSERQTLIENRACLPLDKQLDSRDHLRFVQTAVAADDWVSARAVTQQSEPTTVLSQLPYAVLAQAEMNRGNVQTAVSLWQNINAQAILGGLALDAYTDESYAEAALFGEGARTTWSRYGLQSVTEADLARRVLSMLGQIYANKQPDPLAAAAVYAELTTLTPDNLDAYLNASRQYQQGGDRENALLWANAAQERFPTAWQPAYCLGLIFLAQQQTEKAVTQLQHALELDGNQAPIWFQLGRAFQLQGELTAAIEAYEQAHALAPDDADFENALNQAKANLDE